MGATLRVDPERLRTAARAEANVGMFISGLAAGQSLTAAGDGLPGLSSEGACRFAAALLDGAATAVHDELTAHTDALTAAADQYQRTDAELGRRLHEFAG